MVRALVGDSTMTRVDMGSLFSRTIAILVKPRKRQLLLQATANRQQGRGVWGTGNGERATGNGQRGTGNGERATENGEYCLLQ